MLLPLLRQRRSQPQDHARLARSNPLTRGLFVAVDGRTGMEMVSGRMMTAVGSVPRVATRSGIGARSDGTSSYLTIDIAPKSLSAGTIAWFGRATGTPGLDTRVFTLASSSTNDPLLMINASASNSAKMRTFWRDNAGNYPVTLPDTTATAFSTGAPIMNAVRVTSTNGANQGVLDAFVNGVYDVSSSAFSAGGLTVNRVGVGCLARAAASSFFAGDSVLCLAWDRALSDEEIADISRDPWQLFAPSLDPLYIPSGSTILAAIGEAFSLSANHTIPTAPIIPLPRPVRQLQRPLGRRQSAMLYGDEWPTHWSPTGTLANILRRANEAEGPHTQMSVFTCLSKVSNEPVSELRFTVLARVRVDYQNSGVLFALGNGGNSNQHYLTTSNTGPTMSFVVYGWNGSSNTIAVSGSAGFVVGRWYSLAVVVRPLLTEIWLDGVKVVSTANTMSSEAHTMTHVVLNGSMSSGSASAAGAASSFSAFTVLPNQVLTEPELRFITGTPRGIHRFLEQRRQPFLLPQIIGNTYTDDVQDAVVLSESVSRSSTVPGDQTESVTASEAVTGLQEAQATNSEALALSDGITRLAAYAVTIPEAIAATDGQAVVATLLGSASEAIAVTETQAAVMVGLATIGEPLSLADTSNGSTTGLWVDSVDESVALADGRVANAALLASRAEAVAMVDAGGAAGLMPATLSESIAPTDAVAKVAVLVAQALEAVTLSDGASMVATVAASLSDALAVAAATNGVVMTLSLGGAEGTVYVVMQLLSVAVETQDLRVVVPMDEDEVAA